MIKKIFVVLVLISTVSFVLAQKGNVFKALSYKESGKLDLAIQTIQTTIDPLNEKSAKSINWARTWEIRGEIYQAVFKMNEKDQKSSEENPLSEAFWSYKKALELDSKNKFSKSLKINLALLNNDLQNQGVKAFYDEDYKKALQSFELILAINELPIIRSDNPNALDTAILYNAGLSAAKSGDYDKAIGYLKAVSLHGYNGASIFPVIAGVYEQKKDTLAALEILKQGSEKYPENNEILAGMIQTYINLGQRKNALKYLEMAIRQDSCNSNYYQAMGRLYEENGDEEEALKAYQKAIDKDPQMFPAYYNIGVFYYNKGIQQWEIAGKVSTDDNESYRKEIQKADNFWEKALPFMEKCHELNPTDEITLESLKNLYYRLKHMEKYNLTVEKLKK